MTGVSYPEVESFSTIIDLNHGSLWPKTAAEATTHRSESKLPTALGTYVVSLRILLLSCEYAWVHTSDDKT
jgi:hypothetical protein